MQNEVEVPFLAACAAGGAVAPTLALIAQIIGAGGDSNPVKEAERFKRLLSESNQMANTCTPDYPCPAHFTDDHYVSVHGTTVRIAPRGDDPWVVEVCEGYNRCGVWSSEDKPVMQAAESDYYRVRAARAAREWLASERWVSGESQWDRLARFCAMMAVASRRAAYAA